MFTDVQVAIRGAPINDGNLLKRQMNEALRQGYRAAAENWSLEDLPVHFRREAYSRYGYTPRIGEPGTSFTSFPRTYTGRKLRAKGHTRPMVYSGESESRAKRPRIVPTSKGVRVYINAPALNFRPADGRIDMRDELVRTTDKEAGELIQLHTDATKQAMDAMQRPYLASVRW